MDLKKLYNNSLQIGQITNEVSFEDFSKGMSDSNVRKSFYEQGKQLGNFSSSLSYDEYEKAFSNLAPVLNNTPIFNYTPEVENKNNEIETRFNKIKDELDKNLSLKFTGNKYIEVKDEAYKQLAVLKQKALNSTFQDKEGENALLSSFEKKQIEIEKKLPEYRELKPNTEIDNEEESYENVVKIYNKIANGIKSLFGNEENKDKIQEFEKASVERRNTYEALQISKLANQLGVDINSLSNEEVATATNPSLAANYRKSADYFKGKDKSIYNNNTGSWQDYKNLQSEHFLEKIALEGLSKKQIYNNQKLKAYIENSGMTESEVRDAVQAYDWFKEGKINNEQLLEYTQKYGDLYNSPKFQELYARVKNTDELNNKSKEEYFQTVTNLPGFKAFEEDVKSNQAETDETKGLKRGYNVINDVQNKLIFGTSSLLGNTANLAYQSFHTGIDGNRNLFEGDDKYYYDLLNKHKSKYEIGIGDKEINLPSGNKVVTNSHGDITFRDKEYNLIHDDKQLTLAQQEYSKNTSKPSYIVAENLTQIPAEATSTLVDMAPPLMVSAGLTAITGGGGSVAASQIYTTLAFTGDMYASMFNQLLDEGIDPTTASRTAWGISLGTSALSTYVTGKMGVDLPKALAGKGGVEGLTYNNVRNLIPSLMREGFKPGNNFVKEFMDRMIPIAKNAIKVGVEEGTQEVLEEGVTEPMYEYLSRDVASTLSGDKNINKQSLFDLGFLDPNSMSIAFFSGALMGGAMSNLHSKAYAKTLIENLDGTNAILEKMVKNGVIQPKEKETIFNGLTRMKERVDEIKTNNIDEELFKKSSLNPKQFSPTSVVEQHAAYDIKLEDMKQELLSTNEVKEIDGELVSSSPELQDKVVEYNNEKIKQAQQLSVISKLMSDSSELQKIVNTKFTDILSSNPNVEFNAVTSPLIKFQLKQIEIEQNKENPDEEKIKELKNSIQNILKLNNKTLLKKQADNKKSINEATSEEELKSIEDNEHTIPLKELRRKEIKEEKEQIEKVKKQKELEEDDMHLAMIEDDLKSATTDKETIKKLNKHIANPVYERIKHKLEEHKNRLLVKQKINTFEKELNNISNTEDKIKHINDTYKKVRNKQFKEYLSDKLKEFNSVIEPIVVETTPVIEHSASFDQIDNIKEEGYIYSDASEMILFRLNQDDEGNESVTIFNNLGSNETYLIENNVFPDIPGLPNNLDIKQKYSLIKNSIFGRTLPLLINNKPIVSPQAKPELFDYEFINSLKGNVEVELEVLKNDEFNTAASQIILIKVQGKPVGMLPDSDNYGVSTTHFSPEFLKAKDNLAQLRIDIFNSPEKQFKLKAQVVQGFFKYGERQNLTVLGAEKWKFGMKISSGKNEGQFGHSDMPFNKMKSGIVYAITDKGLFIPLITKKLGDMPGMQSFVFQLNEYINNKNFKAAKELIENNKIFSLYLPIDENGLVDYQFAKPYKKLFQYDEASKKARIIGDLEEFINESYVQIRPQDLKSKRLIEALQTNIEGTHNTSVSINFVGEIKLNENGKKEEKAEVLDLEETSGVSGSALKDDPDLKNIDPTIIAARSGDKQAQKKLEKYGLDWEQTTTYRFVGQSEVDVLLSNNKVESKRGMADAGIDVTTSPKVTSAASNEYRVTFKESFDVNNGLGKVKSKSKEEGDHNLEKGRGYDINDVAKIEKIDEKGNVVETIYESAPTQYTEAATPAKKESGGVSGSALKDVEREKADTERRKQALRDLMQATGDELFILGTEDGTFAGDGLLNMNENGDVVLTRFTDSEENLTKGKGKTENLANIAGQFGGEQIATSGVEGGLQSFTNGVIGEYHIPLQDLINLIKEGYVVFAGLGNKEFVLSPHIADKYLSSINGKKINAKYDAELKAEIKYNTKVEEKKTIKKKVIGIGNNNNSHPLDCK